MRLILELLLGAGLVYLFWEKPAQEWMPWSQPPATPVVAAASASTPSGAWMWDKNRKGPLDKPAYNHHYGVSHAPTLYNATSVTHYYDQTGRTYWVDSRGQRHYDP